MGSAQFQIAPHPSLHFSISTAPPGVVSVTYRDFSLLHGPFWSGSLCLFGFCLPSLQCLVSALTQARGGGLLLRFRRAAGRHWRCFPRPHCSGSRLLYMERALRSARFQPSGVPQKRGLHCACVLCLPCPSGSGSQELDGRTVPGAARLLPSVVPASVSACAGRVPAPPPLRIPSPSHCQRRSGVCALCLAGPSRRMSTIQNLRRSLVRNWRPVCSAVGLRSLGPSLPLSPPLCLLPPAGLGRSAAG